MKRILCVAVLIGLTTALHAVTYTWDATSKSFKNGNDTLGAYTDISKLVITVECARFTNTYIADYFKLAQKDGTNLLKFSVAQGNNAEKSNITVTNNTTTAGDEVWSEIFAGDGTFFTAVFTFDKRNDQGGFQWLVASYDFTAAKAAHSEIFKDINADFNGKSFDQLTAFDGTVITSASIEIEGTPVPEPGVMGLLALGAGALALRRKVARA